MEEHANMLILWLTYSIFFAGNFFDVKILTPSTIVTKYCIPGIFSGVKFSRMAKF